MRTLLVDNYDSYTYNLFQLIAEVNGTEPVVVVNNDPVLASFRGDCFDNVVISPGPGGPRHARDIGYGADLLRECAVPVLGVCLGHQLIAYVEGGAVGLAPQPRHGHLSTVRHDGDELFAGVPATFTAVRYHSLRVAEPLPPTLVATAWAEDGVIMAVRHTGLPRWGVQFHPESVASTYGRQIMVNFADLTRRRGRRAAAAAASGPAARRAALPSVATVTTPPRRALQLAVRAVRPAGDTEAIFLEFYSSAERCFWLDSSLAQPGLSRFSFLGDGSGPLAETLTYRVGTGRVRIEDARGVRTEDGSAFDVLDHRLQDRRLHADPSLPFDFAGGYVGYFGYEMKADSGAARGRKARTPDAFWMFADRLIAVDHQTGITYLVAVHDGSRTLTAAARDWMDQSEHRLAALPPHSGPPAGGCLPLALPGHLARDKDQYHADIRECLRQLARGESYEVCLTNTLRLPFHDDDLAFYRRLRRANPAPYAALLRGDGFTVFSSSPERFLRIGADGTAETRPIKGTAPRHPDPAQDARLAEQLAASPKARAENLMIVDLMRNDLGQVCQPGSVTVPRYLTVETYTTLHQLVSTIRGQLSPGVSAVECARHCFPPGSMTGAPKLRTMEIIDKLETEARGIYAGALGYFGLAGGADLSVVIRTAVRTGHELTVGAGGAIVLDSQPDDEYQEMLLKAATPLHAYRPASSAEPTQ